MATDLDSPDFWECPPFVLASLTLTKMHPTLRSFTDNEMDKGKRDPNVYLGRDSWKLAGKPYLKQCSARTPWLDSSDPSLGLGLWR